MVYLSKSSVLSAYCKLSLLSENPITQGATQKVSALRYFIALDMFYKTNGTNCDTKNNSDKELFSECVGNFVSVNSEKYTSNFYYPLTNSDKDYNCGSNFYSVNVIKESITNPNRIFDFPRRGKMPLIKIQNGTLIHDVSLYHNLNSYLGDSGEMKAALVIWLLRNNPIKDETSSGIKDALGVIITNPLYQILTDFEEELLEQYLSFSESVSYINDMDIKQSVNPINNKMTLNTPHTNSYKKYLLALRTKPFLLLAGISGTGKSRIVREFAFKSCPKYLQDKDGTTPGNYCMIEVKPNWHDSTELLGYYSNLSKEYQFKKFVKFLVKAKMFPDVPFFVCLDEMNLAPVEQYFAEVLSILETRKHPRNPETKEVDMKTIKTEVIVEAKYFQQLEMINGSKNITTGLPAKQKLTDRDIYMKLYGIDEEKDINEEVGNKTELTTLGLTLPGNVLIIGTVNMDDTTHQFSRKVIDRAMTIEMNGGNLSAMFGGSKNLEYLEDEAEQQKWQNAFTQRYISADEVLEAHPQEAETILEKLPERLNELNKALKGTPFEVSYRVLNELTIMVGVLLDDNEEGKSIDDIINQAVDNILLMKILPRIEGDADMFAIKKKDVQYDNRLKWLESIAPDISTDGEEEEKDSKQTAREKIHEMIERLDNQEFTRFWP